MKIRFAWSWSTWVCGFTYGHFGRFGTALTLHVGPFGVLIHRPRPEPFPVMIVPIITPKVSAASRPWPPEPSVN